MSKENSFRGWLEKSQKYDGETIEKYIDTLKNAVQWFGAETRPAIFENESVWEVQRTLRFIRNSDDYDEIVGKHADFLPAVTAYQKYLNSKPQLDYSWTDFYSKFADALLTYKNNRSELIEIIKQVYANLNMKLPTLDADRKIADIDPFTVFGLFNKGITDANRIKIMKGFAETLGMKSQIPTVFTGVPVLNNLSATFYWFQGQRKENDIDNLWTLLDCAVNYSANKNADNKKRLISAFDTVLPQGGIRWNVTMGLFWARPLDFLSLDSRNRWFIINPENLTEKFTQSLPDFVNVPSGTKYLDICDSCTRTMQEEKIPFSNFPELSAFAWAVSEEENDWLKTM